MAKITLPDGFQRSYAHFPEYPKNIILNGAGLYASTLQAIKDRLDHVEDELCLSEGDLEHFEVPIRDLRGTLNEDVDVDKENLHTPNRLSNWLGAHFESVEKGHVIACKRDPMCRFIYIYSDTSRERLKITRNSLAEIFTYHQVMPAYLDFMSVFGLQADAKDLKFSGFRELNIMRESPNNCAIPSLGRSGRQFQLCYNLKGVTLKSLSNEGIKLQEWSIRQAAIHHQFDIIIGTTLWIITKGRLDLQQRFKKMTGREGRPEDRSFGTIEESFRSSLAAHLLYCHWATEDWRGYIRWLEQVTSEESEMAVYGPRDPDSARKDYKPVDIQQLQYWQNKTNEAIIVLQTNMDVVISLRDFYQALLKNKDFPEELKTKTEDDIVSFAANLEQITIDFKLQIERAKLLADTIREHKGLILQHIQSQAAERTEQLNVNIEREALGMRIITIVTLLYLPATFVSIVAQTFFSTDVIKYQRQGEEVPGDGSFSTIAMKRWLQVTLPLTFLTLLLAWTIYKIETAKRTSKSSKPATTSHMQNEMPFTKTSRSFSAPSQQQSCTCANTKKRREPLRTKNVRAPTSWTKRAILPFYTSANV